MKKIQASVLNILSWEKVIFAKNSGTCMVKNLGAF